MLHFRDSSIDWQSGASLERECFPVVWRNIRPGR